MSRNGEPGRNRTYNQQIKSPRLPCSPAFGLSFYVEIPAKSVYSVRLDSPPFTRSGVTLGVKIEKQRRLSPCLLCKQQRRIVPISRTDLVDQNIASWNRITTWLRAISQLRDAA